MATYDNNKVKLAANLTQHKINRRKRAILCDNNRVMYFPLKATLIFLVLTEILVFVGPVEYDLQKPILLIFYLLLVNMAFYWGYKVGVKRFKPSNFRISIETVDLIIVLGLILNVVRLFAMWRSHGLSVSLYNLISALTNPADAYFSEATESMKTDYISLLLSPITWACLPLGVYKWNKLSKFSRFLLIVIAFVQIVSWLGIGTRKGLFDLVIITTFIIIASKSNILTDNKLRKRFIIIITLAIVLFVFYFVFSNLSRYDLSLKEINDYNTRLEANNFYVKHCPTWLLVSLINITWYLCQGYYALSVGLSMGILPPTFLGSSWYTMVIAHKLGYDPMPDTYLAALEPIGIDARINWHTIYLWLANDFTFIGVPIIIFIIGYFFAKTWCDCVKGNNDFAIPLFSLFLIMVFYFYANNQVLSFSFYPFVGWFLFYELSRWVSSNKSHL